MHPPRVPQGSRLPPILDAVLHAWRSLGGFGSAASPDSPSYWQQQRRPPAAARGALALAPMHGKCTMAPWAAERSYSRLDPAEHTALDGASLRRSPKRHTVLPRLPLHRQRLAAVHL